MVYKEKKFYCFYYSHHSHNLLTTFSQLSHNFLTTFSQLFHNFHISFSQLYHNFITTLSQLSYNFLTTFRQLSHKSTTVLIFFNCLNRPWFVPFWLLFYQICFTLDLCFWGKRCLTVLHKKKNTYSRTL